MTVSTQPNPRLIPGGDKRFPFPPGWVHPFEGLHPWEGFCMAVDLKWRDALLAVGIDYRGYPSAWPEKMAVHWLALLQRPVNISECIGMGSGDVAPSQEFASVMAMKSALLSACEGDSLHYELDSASDSGPLIRPHNFADWLRHQGECPSIHIANWLNASGVAAPKVVQLAPLPPAVEAVAKPADKSPAFPATWDELVAWPARKEPGFTWVDDLRWIVAREKQRRADAGHSGVAKSMGIELGRTPRRINELIAAIGKKGSRSQVLSRAIAGVRDGTNGKNGR